MTKGIWSEKKLDPIIPQIVSLLGEPSQPALALEKNAIIQKLKADAAAVFIYHFSNGTQYPPPF